jgi:hypothetical protein
MNIDHTTIMFKCCANEARASCQHTSKQTLIDNDPLNKQSNANMSFTGEPHLKKHKRWCT